MTLRERLLEVDDMVQAAHQFLIEQAMGKPHVRPIEEVINKLTLARSMVRDLAEEPTQN